MIEYKGYYCSMEYDVYDKIFVGHVLFIKDSINFSGKNLEDFINSFHNSIDDYLDMCKAINKIPEI